MASAARIRYDVSVELAIRVRIEALPEGVYLATSDDLQGLVAQGRTIAETLDNARDVAHAIIESRREHDEEVFLPAAFQRDDFTIVVAA